jgi:hypothetical protein
MDNEGNVTINGNAINCTIRIIDDINGTLEARLIKAKNKANADSILICNVPDVRDVINKGGICLDFVQKYFASAYACKLRNLPNVSKIVDLLTPQAGGGFTANPLTKAFNDLAKITIAKLRVKFPTKARLLSEKAFSGYLLNPSILDFVLGKVVITGKDGNQKTLTASEYFTAIARKVISTFENTNFDAYVEYAKAKEEKLAAKEVDSASDFEDSDLDI